MANVMGSNRPKVARNLRSAFLGTTSLYALLLTAPAMAQDASDNCALPDLTGISSVTVPAIQNQIFENDTSPNTPGAYFITCTQRPSIGYIFTPDGDMTVINTSGGIVDTSTLDGGVWSDPDVPTFGAFANGDSNIAVVNFGQVNSTGIAMTGGTITGDLTGYNSGTVYTEYLVGNEILGLQVYAPLAPGMVFVSGSANQSGIFSTSTEQTAGTYTVGGNNVSGVNAGAISVINHGTITTGGLSSPGVVAIATGGDGGVGQSANANNQYVSVAVGGNGGSGGNGGAVTVENYGSINTQGLNSMGVKALSVGGGGGSGGTASAQSTGNDFVSASFSLALGGDGGVGGNGEAVTVGLNSGSTIQTGSTSTDRPHASLGNASLGTYTAGDHSPGVLAQSIGGGGGSGGHAVSLAQGGGIVSVAVAVSKGGTGGAGGDGGAVTVTSDDGASIVTGGRFAGGIVAQSIGGGGGSGGTVNSQSDSTGVVSANVSVAMGAAGGRGGSSGVTQAILNGGSVTTYGMHSTGVLAQSIAGGGGYGGNVVDGSGTNAPISVTAQVNMGGDAGNGGTTGTAAANVSSGATVTTYGDHSMGVVVQSIGGGGGNGGSVHSYSHATGAGTAANSIDEDGSLSSLTLNAQVNLGGKGGTAADASTVSSGIGGTVETYGVAATGVLVQSIGGGGGNGGHINAHSDSETVDGQLFQQKINNIIISPKVDIGGSGGSGGDGEEALIALWGGSVTTNQIRSSGIVAQSIGGGGGNGGYTSSLDVTTSIPTDPDDIAARYAAFIPGSDAEVKGNLQLSFNLGGNGGGSGNGGLAVVQLDGGQVTTNERQSHGVVAQSVGGGGGMGGHAAANGFVGIGTYSFNAALGGAGGSGGNGGSAQVYRAQSTAGIANITTQGDQSYGIFAQSVGGGGGSAGAAHLDLEKAPAGLSNLTLGLTLGGSGGTGGSGSTVDVRDATITTSGVQSHGVMAQSIGGGGGNATLSGGGGATTLNLGGSGGTGGSGGALTLRNISSTTSGNLATGMFAQSVGGGGGLAGIAGTDSLLDEAAQSTVNTTFTLNTNGSSGDGGTIVVGCQSGQSDTDCGITASTSGTTAAGMILQSIGSGGSATFLENAPGNYANVGFGNGVAANSGLITVTDQYSGSFNVSTSGDGAVGIVAQSVAGTGGALFTDNSLSYITVDVTSSTSSGKSGGFDLSLDSATINTSGDYAPGMFLQSGNALYTVFASDGQKTYAQEQSLLVPDLQVTNNVYLSRDASITTSGTQSHGMVADTHSYFGSTNPASADTSDRSLNIWIDGSVSVSGADSWGVMGSNTWIINGIRPIPAANNVTTAFTLGSNATINVAAGAAGGVKLTETGNVTANIYGMINGNGTTLVDITAGNSSLTLGDPNTDWQSGIFQTYDGDLMVTGNASGGIHNITLNPGTVLNGGITVDTSNGAAPNISVLGSIHNLGSDAIALGQIGSGATVSFQDVRGNITATGNPNDSYATVTNNYLMHGSVNGDFVYEMAAGSSHTLDIDAANNTSDIISVRAFSRDTTAGPNGNVAYINLNLTSLPTPDFKSVTIIDIANGATQVATSTGDSTSLSGIIDPAGGWGFGGGFAGPVTTSAPVKYTEQPNYDLSNFDIDNANNVIDYDYDASVQGNAYVVVINGITIKLDQPVLTGHTAQMAALAQSHIDGIADGSITPDPTSSIYKTLLTAANAAEGTDGQYTNLKDTLSYLTGTSLDPDTQSTTNAQRNATDSMHSCGGAQGAAVNPVEQGECAWSSITRTNVTLAGAAHDESSTNLAVGWQKAVGEKSYLGFAFGYDDADIDRTATNADADRLHAGAVYKYVDGNLFASSSLLATYSATDAQRTYADVSDDAVTHTATSKRKSLAFASRLRAGYSFSEGAFDLTPMVDLDLFLNRQFKYEEAGSGGLESYVGGSTNFLADVHPRVQLGTHFDVGSAAVRLYGEIGQRFALNDADVNFGLLDGLAGDATVAVVQEREGRQTSWGLGMVADLGDRFEMRVTYDVTDGSLEKNERLGFKLAYKF